MKHICRFVLFAFLASLLAACGQKTQDPNAAVAVVVALTQTASALSAPTPTAPTAVPPSGVISGTVGMVAPPSPHMTVYALDPATGRWASADVPANPAGSGAFSLKLLPGSYQVFAFTDDNAPAVHSTDWLSLTPVKVDANQTVTNINLQSDRTNGTAPECAVTLGVPASPDGKFKAVPGPTPACIAQAKTLQAQSAAAPDASAPVRVQFPAGSSSWSTPVDVQPAGTSAFVLYALKGQTMTVTLDCTPPSSGSFYLRTAGGLVLMPRAFKSWTMTLPASQDYVTGVDNPTQSAVHCTLGVSIPPAAGAPAAQVIAKSQAIRFATGPMTVEVKGAVISGQRDRYTLSMLKGENLDVIITSNEANAVFSIIGPDNNPLPGTEEGKDTNNWSVPAPSDGAYAILVGPTRGNATYTLKVSVTGP